MAIIVEKSPCPGQSRFKIPNLQIDPLMDVLPGMAAD